MFRNTPVSYFIYSEHFITRRTFVILTKKRENDKYRNPEKKVHGRNNGFTLAYMV